MKLLHRGAFFGVLVIAFLWGVICMKPDFADLLNSTPEWRAIVRLTLFAGIPAVFWPVAYVEMCDFVASLSGRNGKLYRKYATSIKKDLVVPSVAAFLLCGIYWFDAVPYNFSGIDIGFVGIPFLISAVYAMFQIFEVKLGGTLVKSRMLWGEALLLVGIGVGAIYALREISSGQFESHKAIWLQLTILFASFFAFTSTHLQLRLLQSKELGTSGFKLYFFTQVLGSSHGPYSALKGPVEEFNKRVRRLGSMNSANLRKSAKK